MTKKYFISIAENIFEASYLSDDQKLKIANDLAIVFAQVNNRFDTQKFINACTGH